MSDNPAVSTSSAILQGAKILGVTNLLGFAVTALTKSHAFFDGTAIFSQFVAVVYGYHTTQRAGFDINENTRTKIVTMMGLAWALRLGSFLVRRVLHVGEDRRLRPAFKSIRTLGFYWFLNALWAFSNITPILAIQAHSSGSEGGEKEKMKPFDWAITALWGFLWLWQAVADEQKYRFRNNPANADKWISTGLYRYCRYPNYFAEIGMWTAVCILAVRELAKENWWVMNSPVLCFLLLRFVSGIPILEKGYMKRFGSNPAWIKYRANTNMLIPWFPK
jgi:steroid 5-alpha reductase family enzyme